MMPNRTLTVVILMLAVIRSAAAAGPTDVLVRLFIDVCIANLGKPDKVRDWAEAHHLGQIQNPTALGVFVGPGQHGAAWAIPLAEGKFALSIRGTTRACAVWAQNADPAQVLANFRQIIEGVKRPGINVTVDKDEVGLSPFGQAHALAYNVTAPNAPTSFEFVMLTAERPGGAFQASMQAAKAGAH